VRGVVAVTRDGRDEEGQWLRSAICKSETDIDAALLLPQLYRRKIGQMDNRGLVLNGLEDPTNPMSAQTCLPAEQVDAPSEPARPRRIAAGTAGRNCAAAVSRHSLALRVWAAHWRGIAIRGPR